MNAHHDTEPPKNAIFHAACGCWWTGLGIHHCCGCGRNFTSVSAFDKHRDGSHARGTRHCIDPAAVGLVDAGRKFPCWGWPGDDERWADDEADVA